MEGVLTVITAGAKLLAVRPIPIASALAIVRDARARVFTGVVTRLLASSAFFCWDHLWQWLPPSFFYVLLGTRSTLVVVIQSGGWEATVGRFFPFVERANLNKCKSFKPIKNYLILTKLTSSQVRVIMVRAIRQKFLPNTL